MSGTLLGVFLLNKHTFFVYQSSAFGDELSRIASKTLIVFSWRVPSAMNTTEDNKPLYHERQTRMMCAMHCVNNVLQSHQFLKSDMDKICQELAPNHTWCNPHCNPLGLGNYDVNVMMVALQQKNLELVWFDRRNSVRQLNLDAIQVTFVLYYLNALKTGCQMAR